MRYFFWRVYIHLQIIKETTLCNLASYVQYEGNVKTWNGIYQLSGNIRTLTK